MNAINILVDIMEEEEKDQDALSQENESYQAFIQQ